MKKIVSLLLLLAMLLLALASCGGKTEETEPPVQTTDGEGASGKEPETTVTGTADPWENYGRQVSRRAEFQRTFTIELSKHSDAEKTSKNDRFVAGPDEIQPGVTPRLDEYVYERNKKAIDLMDLIISYVYWDYEWSKQGDMIKTVVLGNAKDAPDLFVNMIYDLNVATLSGTFKDIRSIPASYFNFDAQGWMTEWMESLSVTGDRAYVLGGDYFLDILRAMGALPVNITLMNANREKLAPAILGSDESLEENEKLSIHFFDFVEEGKWTWTTLHDLCEAIWVDVDGNEQDSISDTLGIVADNFGGLTSELYIFSCSGNSIFTVAPVEDPTSEYYEKDWIYYSTDPTALGNIFDAVTAVYSGHGSLSTTGSFAQTSPDNPGAALHRMKFAEGTLLTAGAVVLGALEDESFQTMTDIFTVVPLPKISPENHYNTVIHTIGDAGAINVNTRKAVAISAFLQYCCEHSSNVRNEFLENVTKFKTTIYDQGTDRMLDLIYDSVINGRDKTLEDYAVSDDRLNVIMKKGFCEVPSSTLVTKYEASVSSKQRKLDSIIRTWYTLPKVEPAGE